MEYALGAVVIAAALLGAGHAVIYKREPRSAASLQATSIAASEG